MVEGCRRHNFVVASGNSSHTVSHAPVSALLYSARAVFISPSECSACVRGVSRSAARGFARLDPTSMHCAKSRISYLGAHGCTYWAVCHQHTINSTAGMIC
jgi:hypothetical protein